MDVSLFLEIYDSPISITLDAGLAYSIVPNEPLPPQPFCFCEILAATSGANQTFVKQPVAYAHAPHAHAYTAPTTPCLKPLDKFFSAFF